MIGLCYTPLSLAPRDDHDRVSDGGPSDAINVRAYISLWTRLCKVTPVILHGVVSPESRPRERRRTVVRVVTQVVILPEGHTRSKVRISFFNPSTSKVASAQGNTPKVMPFEPFMRAIMFRMHRETLSALNVAAEIRNL